MNGARHRFALAITVLFMLGLTGLYPFLLYTSNGFVTRWREWYIETAMSTMSHQWLATYFIPGEIIDEVMVKRYLMQEKQAGLESVWEQSAEQTETDSMTPYQRFEQTFSELDMDSFNAFIKENPEYLEVGYDKINIDKIDSRNTGMVTKAGDEVLAINAEHGIMIVEVTGMDELTGEDYVGKVALVKQPENVFVGTTKYLRDYGSYVSDMVRQYDAILGINASGFEDDNGEGNGGVPYGFLKSQGEEVQQAVGGDWKIIGFDDDNHLQIGAFSNTDALRDAVEFQPALIINGEVLVEDSGGNGVQPRTAIGQALDGTVIMLVVDGRQTHSVGCTYGEAARIMDRYNAVQASALDGGSSSVMVYDGREITKPTTVGMNAEGRTLPDAFLVK